MATFTVTAPEGGKTVVTGMTVARPEHAMTEAEASGFALGTGLEAAAFADLMSAFLAHERCGVHLYRAAAGAVSRPEWRERFEEFGSQTEEHVEILESLVARLGGDPMFVSPTGRMVEFMDSKLMEPILLAGSVPQATCDLALLEAVVLAERKCHNNWTFLGELVGTLEASDATSAIKDAVARVEDQEDEHVAWAEQAWTDAVRERIGAIG